MGHGPAADSEGFEFGTTELSREPADEEAKLASIPIPRSNTVRRTQTRRANELDENIKSLAQTYELEDNRLQRFGRGLKGRRRSRILNRASRCIRTLTLILSLTGRGEELVRRGLVGDL